MTEFHALDLSGDRAALHRWDGRGWQPVASAPGGAGQDARALADLLSPVAGKAVMVVLPSERIAAQDIDAMSEVAIPPETRVDWVATKDGGWRRLALPRPALDEIEAFLRALGVVPAGCLADAGPGLPAAWFGTADSLAPDGRATDRPACLGPAGPAPDTRITAARRRAEIAAQRDPAHLAPLPDMPDPEDAVDPAVAAWGLRAGSRIRAAAGTVRPVLLGGLVLAALVAGLAVMRGGAPVGPEDRTPDMVALATAPAQMPRPAPDIASPRSDRLDPTARSVVPAFGPPPDDSARVAPRLARQAALSAMDAPPGMVPGATFYTPPFGLGDLVTGTAETLIIPGLDPVFRTDALALAAIAAPDPAPGARRAITAPPPPDEVFVVDARGLIRPSVEGRLSPDGFTVVAGRPDVAARPRPERAPTDTGVVRVMRRAALAEDDPLRRLLPRARPDGLAEARERTRFGGRTATELAGFVPVRRPLSAQERAGTTVVTAAVVSGPRPTPRDDAAIARARAAAQAPTGPAIAAADVARVSAPTPSATADRATARVGIDLSEINLLGTFGSASNRRALVRLPSGRVVNLSVGDRVDGGRVQDIGDGRLGYVKSGRTVTLSMPRG